MWPAVRGVLVGSGSDGLTAPAVCAAIMRLAAKPRPRCVYLGTATYDLAAPMQVLEINQTQLC